MPSPLPDHTPNYSFSLAIMMSFFFISGCYPEILWLLWKLQSSMLFHLSIVSMMSLHSTGSYLETLQAPLAIILKLFEFSGRYNHSRSISYRESFWILWLLSPFLHVTISGDQTPIQKVLPDLGLVSATSFS
jgi:hypothetical protein